MRVKQILIMTSLIILIFNINLVSQDKDFYIDSGDRELARLPLLYPYEALMLYGSQLGWRIENIQDEQFNLPNNIIEFYLSDNYIYGKCGKTNYFTLKENERYFVIDAKAKNAFFFFTIEEFKKKLVEINITDYKPESLDTLYKTFVEKGRCYWFPDYINEKQNKGLKKAKTKIK